jgi:hypothetical protein
MEVAADTDDTVEPFPERPPVSESPEPTRKSSRSTHRTNYRDLAGVNVRRIGKSVGPQALSNLGLSENFVAEAMQYEIAYRISVKEAAKLYPEAADAAIRKELKQLYDLQTFSPVDPHTLTSEDRKSAIRSFLFLKEKFAADGSFEKLKARMVGGGDRQDRSLYSEEEIASPTATTSSILMCAAIAAKQGRKAVTLDVPGAYLQASLKPGAPRPIMYVEPRFASILCELGPTWSRFLQKDGSMMVRMNKGLYGLIESAKLWNEHLSETLMRKGFVRNPLDPCVFNKDIDHVQCTICVHVDDLLITCADRSHIDDVVNHIISTYGSATVHDEDSLSYLGMIFDFTKKGTVQIKMDGFIGDWLDSVGIQGKADTPALPDLFDVDDSAPPLSPEERKVFHSQVAKALYASKRGRPDLLTAVTFLTTRATMAIFFLTSHQVINYIHKRMGDHGDYTRPDKAHKTAQVHERHAWTLPHPVRLCS